MRNGTQTGEGRLSSFIWLAVFVLVAWAGWNVGPPYLANYTLVDKMNEIARSPRGTITDEKIYDMLMKEVSENGLTEYVRRNNFRVTTLETSRKISLEYQRQIEVLPGFKHVFTFHGAVDQPLLF